MLFLNVLLFLGYANFIAMFRISRRAGKTTTDRVFMNVHTMNLMCFCLAFVIGVGFFADIGIRPPPYDAFLGFARAFTDFKLCVPLFFAFGLGSVLLFSYKLAIMSRTGHDPSTAGWRSGLSLLAILAGFYLICTCYDHWYFFRDDKAGIAAVSMLGVDDVPCGDGMALVRIEEKGARWRCPERHTIVFGSRQLSSKPFLPWPGYTGGVSQKLKVRLEEIISEGIQRNPRRLRPGRTVHRFLKPP